MAPTTGSAAKTVAAAETTPELLHIPVPTKLSRNGKEFKTRPGDRGEEDGLVGGRRIWNPKGWVASGQPDASGKPPSTALPDV